MTLTPVFKSATDTYFNHQAARRAYDLVMKMDEDEARTFTTMVVADTLWADIDANQRTLQRHLNDVVRKRVERVAKTLDRTYVSKALDALKSEDGQFAERDEVLAYAGALAVISKAIRTDWEAKEHPRDPDTGQFTRKLTGGARKPLSDKQAKSMGVRMPNKDFGKPGQQRNRNKAEYQQSYMQLAQFMDTFQGRGGESDFVITFKEKGTGRTYSVRQQGNKIPDWEPKNERPIAVEARPNVLTAGGAAFGLVGALGGGPNAGYTAAHTMQQIGDKDKGLPKFSEDWTGAGVGATSTNARLYGRVETGSRFLGQVAPEGSKVQMAGAFGEFVGQQGPEAERVLGPTTRKTMYRYRGTEKTPDKQLVQRVESGAAGTRDFTPEQVKELRTKQNRALGAARRNRGDISRAEQAQILQQVDQQFRTKGASRTEIAEGRRVRARAAAVAHLSDEDRKGKPKKGLYGLQLASGHTPPSEGVIIDAQGKLATQAVGYGDDHYMPFNLKNLKGLKGGEYVRTRSVGGPTSEDIYTAMLTGARGFAVTSRSGDFYVEFEDDFRGGRRHNQKAKRMVDRYEKLLDAVKSEQVQRQPIPDDVHAEILERVERDLGPEASATELREMENQLIDEFKSQPYISRARDQELRVIAQRDNPEPARQRVAYAAMRNREMDRLSANFALNGDGYAAALTALQEQFPYYIKTADHQPRHEAERFESEKDKGYVMPRHNRPAAALEGYFAEEVAGVPRNAVKGKGGKFRASEADYQNVGVYRNLSAQKAESGEGGAKGGLQPTGAGKNEKVVEAAMDRQDQRDLDAAARDVRDLLRGNASDEGASPLHREIANKNDVELATWMKQGNNQQRLYDEADIVARQLGQKGIGPELRKSINRFEGVRGVLGKEDYDQARHEQMVPDAPFNFPGEARRAAPRDQQERQLRMIARRNAQLELKVDTMKRPEEFKQQLRELQGLKSDAEAATDPASRAALRRSGYNDRQMRIINAGPAKISQAIRDTNLAWRIRTNLDRQAAREGKSSATVGDQGQHETSQFRRQVDTAARFEQRRDKAIQALNNVARDTRVGHVRVEARNAMEEVEAAENEETLQAIIDGKIKPRILQSKTFQDVRQRDQATGADQWKDLDEL